MTGKLKVGGEAESYCTKCKTVLNHRIMAMTGPLPARVECLTCGSAHNYRAKMPKSSSAGRQDKTGEPRVPKAPRAPNMGRSKAAAEERKLAAENELERRWESAVSGHSPSEFRMFKSSESFVVGELVKHTKFGEGVVTEVVDAGAIVVLFREQPRTLAQGMQPY